MQNILPCCGWWSGISLHANNITQTSGFQRWCHYFCLQYIGMHLLMCESIQDDAPPNWQIDSGEDSTFSSQLCALGALELSDTSNAPLARERGREKTSKERSHWWASWAWTQGRSGMERGKRDEEKGKSVLGAEDGWDRNKREEGRETESVRLDLYFI